MVSDQLIISYYNAILRVDPTQSQIDRWLNLIDENDPEPGIEDLADALCLQANEILSIMRIYQVVLGRVPDSDGLDFWVQTFRDVQDANPDLTYREALVETIRDWLSSEEFVTVYGDDLTDEEYVAFLYINVLNRSADQEGFDFWVNELESGAITREDLVIAFSESVEFKLRVDAEAKGILLYDAQTSSVDTIDDPEHRVEGDDPYQGELHNEDPTDILVDAADVDENAEDGDIVNGARLTAVDPDAGETFTWELIDPSGAFGLDDPNAQRPNIIVIDASKLDHETADVMTVTVRVTDSRGNSYEEDVVINVNDINEAPYNLQPADVVAVDHEAAVDEVGDVVATLTVDDEDVDDSHAFAITTQTISGAFMIVGNELQVADPALLGTGIHEITIRVTDSGDLETEQTVTVDLTSLEREDGEVFVFTSDGDALVGTDGDDVFRANSGDEDGNGQTANAGDFADGGAGHDHFVLIRANDDEDPDRAYVTGVELNDIEALEIVNADDAGGEDPEETTELEWGDCEPLIDMPSLGPDDTSSIVFDASLSPDLDHVVFRNSSGSGYVRDLQRDFWTRTEGDDSDNGATVDIIDVTAERIWIDSDTESKQFEDLDGDGKDDGEIVFNLDEARISEIVITENANDADPEGDRDDGYDGGRGEQVGTITLRATGTPSVIGNIVNGEDYNEASGGSTHTLNIEVSDLTGTRPSSSRGDDVGEVNAAAIDLFVGQFGEDDSDGLGDGLMGLENVNITGGGDVFLSFDDDSDHLIDDDGDGFGLEIVDGAGNSFFAFHEGGFANDDDEYASVSLDGGDGYDTLIVYASDLEDDPDALQHVTNIERIVILDWDEDDWDDEDFEFFDGGDDCLLGDDGDNLLIGGKYDDFIDAGAGGTDALVGDYGKDDPDDDDTEAFQDVFVASARENNADAFGLGGYDNDLIPHENYGNLLGKAGLDAETDGSDGGVEGVVYVLDFNQGGGGDHSYTPHSLGSFDKEENTTEGGRFYSRLEEAFGDDADRLQGDKLAFRDSNGELDECGLATNYKEEENSAADRDDADAAAFNAFSANENLRYFVSARTFEDALFEGEGLVWGVDVTEEQAIAAFTDLEDGTDDNDVGGIWDSSQELIDTVMAAKGESWLRVYYNEEGTDAAPEAVMELVGLDSTSQFSFEDIVGKDCIDDCTDPLEYVFC